MVIENHLWCQRSKKVKVKYKEKKKLWKIWIQLQKSLNSTFFIIRLGETKEKDSIEIKEETLTNLENKDKPKAKCTEEEIINFSEAKLDPRLALTK